MQNNNENERVRPRLESAGELKGKKAGGKKKASIGKRWAATIISLVLVLGIVIGAYFVTDALRPVEEEEDTAQSGTDYVSLLEGHSKKDMASLTVYENGEAKYTIKSNLQEKADIVAAEEEAAAEAGESEESEEAEENVSAADSIPDYEVEGMPYFTLNTDAVDSMTTYSFSMLSARLIEENCEDLAKYGLEDPALYVEYTYHDGTTMHLNFGDKVPAGSYHYIRIDDSRDVYMLYQTVRAYFARSLEELHTVPAMATLDTESSMTYLLVEQRGQETIEIVEKDEEDTTSILTLWLVQPIEYATNSERVEEVMTSAAALTLTAYAGYAEDEAALAEYGLAEPYANVAVTDSVGATIAMTIGDTVSGNAAYRYATVDDSGDIYTVDVNLLSFLSNCRVSYLVDQFTNLINIKKVESYEIECGDEVYTAEIKRTDYTDEDGNAATSEEYYFEGEFVDSDTFKKFYQIVIGTLFDKRIEDPEEYAFDGEVAVRLTYHLTYTDEPYTVEYLEYDRDYYAVRKEGYTLFLVRKDKVQEIVDTAELFRNGEYVPEDNSIDPGTDT